jgi:arginine decarboxylase-like protein
MLVDALIANGHCGLDPLPVKNSVRAGMLNLRIKCRALGFELFTFNIGGPAGIDYGITEEAIEYMEENFGVPDYDEMGEIVGTKYLFPRLEGEE